MVDGEHIDWEREKEMIQSQIWDQGEKNKAPCCSSPLCAYVRSFKQIISRATNFHFLPFPLNITNIDGCSRIQSCIVFRFLACIVFSISLPSNCHININQRQCMEWQNIQLQGRIRQVQIKFWCLQVSLYPFQISPSKTKRYLSFPDVRGQI